LLFKGVKTLKAFSVLCQDRRRQRGVILAENREEANSLLPQWRAWYNQHANNHTADWSALAITERVVLVEEPTYSANFQSVPAALLKVVRKVAN